MSGKIRFIFQMLTSNGHYIIYHVVADTPRQARFRIKKHLLSKGTPARVVSAVNVYLELVDSHILVPA